MSLWNQNTEETTGFVQSLLAGRNEIYGVILNDSNSRRQLGDQLHRAPYKTEPKAPAMYIKPRNTIGASGVVVTLPPGENSVEVGAVLGVVIGKTTSRIQPEAAVGHIAGYVTAADLSLPHDSYYRPAIREKCFDGACPIGEPVPTTRVADPSELEITTTINNRQVAKRKLADLHRSVEYLLCDVSEFMTLRRGDILLTGVAYQSPLATCGDRVRVEIDQVGHVEFSLNTAGEGQK